MDPGMIVGLLEPVVAFALFLGAAFGVKFLVWGKGPIRRVRGGPDQGALEKRIAELEERWAELATRQIDQLDEMHERLDFTERMLTQQRADEPKWLDRPEISTPV